MKLTFNGAAHEVTGSCHCLEACNKKIIVDCGMEQGRDIYVNEELPFPISQIDYVFLTHAHIDHSGMLIFRSLKQSGKTEKIREVMQSRWFLSILLRMQKMC